jgi:hypothetical protein
MSRALDLFAGSYIRNLKRPELLNFDPEQSYGANMVFGSNEQNPWANRNQDNAKYGQLGGTQPLRQVITSTTQGEIPGTNITNVPGGSGLSQNTFNNLMAGVVAPVGMRYGSEWMGKSGLDWIKSLLASKPGLVETSLSQAPTDIFGPTAIERVGKDFLKDISMPSQIIEESAEAVSDTTTGPIPIIGPALGLGTKALTGDLRKNPIGAIGSTVGAAGGAALGSTLGPVGTIIGSILGSKATDFFNDLFESIFG